MNYDQIAFLNQQLGEMLRTGIPLEKGLEQLCATMKSGAWKTELDALRGQLARGIPLAEALKDRRLPEFYKHMLTIGARGQDLPGMLILLADHYHRRYGVETRLRGLMVYPTLVLLTSFLLSLGLAGALLYLVTQVNEVMSVFTAPPELTFQLLMPMALIGTIAVLVVAAFIIRPWQRFLQWRLPAFREAALADFADAMGLMLRKGVTVSDALAFYRQLDRPNPLNQELALWQTKLAAGSGKTHEFAAPGQCIPPLFVWFLHGSGEELARGFERAAEIFRARAQHWTDILLYAALPVMILGVGVLMVLQVVPAMSVVTLLLNTLGS